MHLELLPVLVDWAPIPLRLALGISFIFHGYPKLTGQSRAQTMQFMKSIGVPAMLVNLVALLEFLGGIGLVVGFLTQVIGILIFLEMIGTTILSKTKLGKKYMLGYELDIGYMAMALSLALLGPGTLSIDSLIG